MGKGEYGADIAALQPGALISFWVLVGIAVLGLPQTAVRCMGFKDTESMHRAMIYGTVVIGILMIGMHLAGTLAFPLLPEGMTGICRKGAHLPPARCREGPQPGH
jgi:sodium/pantothenate symporter